MVLASSDAEVLGLALLRRLPTTRCGLRFDIDELVTAEAQRSRDVGAAIMLDEPASRRGPSRISPMWV
jgi:hypothetical protein